MRADPDAMAPALRRILFPGERVALALAHEGGATRPLAEEEEALIAGAFPKRRRDFRLGRHCAHRALASVGIDVPFLGVGPAGAPRWPTPVRGAITHSGGLAAAAVSDDPAILGLGLDVECATGSLGEYVWRLAFTDAELVKLRRFERVEAERLACVWFSAKEAAFKAFYGATGTAPPIRRIALELVGNHTAAAIDETAGTICVLRVKKLDRIVFSAATILS